MSTNKNKHLTLEDRQVIETSLNNLSSRSSIAKVLGKDKSTICKEIKRHRYFYKTKRQGVNPNGVFDCIHIQRCKLKFCQSPCKEYQMVPCVQRDTKVGTCNGCDVLTTCRNTKSLYSAHKAYKTYKEGLKDYREGVNLTTSQAKEIGDILKPLLAQGQSLYSILRNHHEINVCEKTLYNYITQGVFSTNGLYDIDLRLKTSRKISKKNVYSKPRENRSYLKGRTYHDFEIYMAEHPHYNVVEMDTVYNDVSNGPFIQTFQLIKYNLMTGILHYQKTARNMVDGLKKIKAAIGEKMFLTLFAVILTDRGTEFTDVQAMEELGCKVFFCDAMASWQKPHVENNHRLLRYVLPNSKDLYNLGLRSQKDLDLIFSHINSYSREALNGKSPIEVFKFFHPTKNLLSDLNLVHIPSDDIILVPTLIKKS